MSRPRRISSGALVTRVFVALLLFAAAGASRAAEAPPGKARDLYRLIGGDRTIEQAADAMLTAIRANPQLQPYGDVIKEWFSRVVATGEFETEMVKLYADAFTDAELDELLAFYRSPLGQKSLERMPELMRRGADIGSRIAKQHTGELEEMIAKRKKELEEKAAHEAEEPKP